MPHRASLQLNVALVAVTLGFGLLAGPVAVIAKVVAVVFFARFAFSLGETEPAVWTEHHDGRTQPYVRPKSSTPLPHEKQ
jgi:uncharacterized membrane protein YtjA (UPF0391 family)